MASAPQPAAPPPHGSPLRPTSGTGGAARAAPSSRRPAGRQAAGGPARGTPHCARGCAPPPAAR
eukprot:6031157-Pyramimonas_sp.AAC.1